MGLPRARVQRRCDLCRTEIHPLLFRYLWINMGWRGRPSGRPHSTKQVVLCGPCADVVLERLAPFLPAGAAKEVVR